MQCILKSLGFSSAFMFIWSFYTFLLLKLLMCTNVFKHIPVGHIIIPPCLKKGVLCVGGDPAGRRDPVLFAEAGVSCGSSAPEEAQD